MQNLAELAFQYLMLLQFGDEDVIDLDYSVSCLESFELSKRSFTVDEKNALAFVAGLVKERINAPPDAYGYQPGLLTTDEEREFIESLISGKAFEEEDGDL